MLSMSGTPNNIFSYQKGDHRCLMEIFYKNFFSHIPTKKQLIDFLHNVDIDKIIAFTEKTIPTPPILSPWTPIVECNEVFSI